MSPARHGRPATRRSAPSVPRPCRSSRVASARKSWAVVRASCSGSCSGWTGSPWALARSPPCGPGPPPRGPGQVQAAVQCGGHACGVQHGGVEWAAPQPTHRRIKERLLDLGDVHHQHVTHGAVQQRGQLLGERRRGRKLTGEQAVDADGVGRHVPVGADQQPERGGRGGPAAEHPQPPGRHDRVGGRVEPGGFQVQHGVGDLPPWQAIWRPGGGQVGADGLGQVGAG
jgi:hypothetical protein